jgi:hypothetical protein
MGPILVLQHRFPLERDACAAGERRMSHTICEDCGARYRDEHECPEDGEMLLTRIVALEEMLATALKRIEALEAAESTGVWGGGPFT